MRDSHQHGTVLSRQSITLELAWVPLQQVSILSLFSELVSINYFLRLKILALASYFELNSEVV